MVGKNKYRAYKRHPFHLVRPSELPFVISWFMFAFVLGLVFDMLHPYDLGCLLSISGRKCIIYLHVLTTALYFLFILSILFMFRTMKRWFSAISIERRNGFHTKAVRRGLRLGFALFIVSEVMLFFAFFWTYFHVSIIVSPELGSWPPVGVEMINPLNLPLANTLLLLFSGWTLHCAHLNVLAKKPPCFWFHLTMGLGWLFILTQAYEYVMAGFTLSTTVYGSIFFFLTGLHGMHVLIGLVFLIFALSSVSRNSQDNTLLDLAAWYWHFVDIVWLVLFISVYWQPILC